jgi:hypothetical protein
VTHTNAALASIKVAVGLIPAVTIVIGALIMLA